MLLKSQRYRTNRIVTFIHYTYYTLFQLYVKARFIFRTLLSLRDLTSHLHTRTLTRLDYFSGYNMKTRLPFSRR